MKNGRNDGLKLFFFLIFLVLCPFFSLLTSFFQFSTSFFLYSILYSSHLIVPLQPIYKSECLKNLQSLKVHLVQNKNK